MLFLYRRMVTWYIDTATFNMTQDQQIALALVLFIIAFIAIVFYFDEKENKQDEELLK